METIDKTIKEWQNSVVEEVEELTGRYGKLAKYLNSDEIKKLSGNSIYLLERQFSVMGEYISILNLRISLFDK